MEEQRVRILMIDDDLVDRRAFERFVKEEQLPYDFTCAGSVAKGKEALENGTFDIVVTDYMLGDGTGFDIFQAAGQTVPVILVTGAGGEEVAVQAMKSGASDYLIKDAEGNYLKTLPVTVESALKARRLELELKKYHEELERLVEDRTLQLREKNEELLREIDERKKAELGLQAAHEELKTAHDKLEIRVEQRTAELRKSNQYLRIQISERQKAEEGLRKSKETVEAILNATTDCAFLLDRDGILLALNNPTAHGVAQSVDRLIGKSYFDAIPPEPAGTRREAFAKVVEKGIAVRFEDRLMGRILDNSYLPVLDSNGKVERVAGFSRDITEQKKAHELLVQRQRVAALGEMAGGVAHNFNNLLQIIVGACGTAQIELEFGDIIEAKRTLGRVVETAQQGSETIKQLQDFAGVRTEDPVFQGHIIDLSQTVLKAVDMSRPLWGSSSLGTGLALALYKQLAPGCYVKGKENELFEVTVNLIKNATEALPDGGEIHVSTFVKDDHAYLKISDNGIGMPKENMTRIFEPFWTTKGAVGAGMGLPTSVGIIKRHEGEISVESEPGKGSTFTVKLPLADRSSIEDMAAPGFDPDIHARVLLLVQMPAFGAKLEILLRSCGHTVLSAESGKKGVDLFKREIIDLVICDLGVKDLNGWQVARAVKDICDKKGVRKVPFILRAGGLENLEKDRRIAECGVDRILSSSFDLSRLPVIVLELAREHLKQH